MEKRYRNKIIIIIIIIIWLRFPKWFFLLCIFLGLEEVRFFFLRPE